METNGVNPLSGHVKTTPPSNEQKIPEVKFRPTTPNEEVKKNLSLKNHKIEVTGKYLRGGDLRVPIFSIRNN